MFYCTKLTASMGRLSLLLSAQFIMSRSYFWQTNS